MKNTMCDEIRELVMEKFSEIDSELIVIIDNIESGNYSDSLIIDSLKELRDKIF